MVPLITNSVAVAAKMAATHRMSFVKTGELPFVFRISKISQHNKNVGSEKQNPKATNKGYIVRSSTLKRSYAKLKRHNNNGANRIVEAQSFKRYNLFIKKFKLPNYVIVVIAS